jgi:UDP-glucose 4-epimerase
MKVLVTGGAGFVGSVLTEMLLTAGHDVVVLDDLSRSDAAAVPAGATLVTARVHDAGEVLDPTFHAVVHLAGFIAAGESVTVPDRYWDNNLVGSLRLIEAARASGVARIVFSSTANVYGDSGGAPLDETVPERPPNPYAASKLAVDHLLRDAAAAHGLAAVSLRYFNVAGAHRTAGGGLLGERHDPETHLIPLALRAATGELPTLTLYGTDYPTPDGTCVRDYIHVTDLGAAHLLALRATVPGAHRVFNLGNGRGFSNREVIDTVREVTGQDVPVVEAARRPGDPAVLVASPDRARAELGWVPARGDLTGIVADAWEFHRGR